MGPWQGSFHILLQPTRPKTLLHNLLTFLTHLEAWQEAAVSLVTSVSRGREAVHHRRSKRLGDGILWESHTLCHWSDT